MHAVVFQVDGKQDSEGDAEAEVDQRVPDMAWDMGGLAEVAVILDMPELRRALSDKLLPYKRLVGTIAGVMATVGPVAYALGRLAAAEGRLDAAVSHYGLAVQTATRVTSRPWVAQARLAWGDALAVSGDVSGATRLREEVRDVAHGLEVVPVLAALDEPPATVADKAPPPEASLILDGEAWRVRLGADTVRLRDTKGLRYLAELIEQPGTEHHALDLVTVIEGAPSEPGLDRRHLGDAGALLDSAAKAAYKRRLADLRDDVAEAEAFNDIERAAKAQDEIDALVQELSRAVGLNGRDRRAASASERARINVTRAIRTAIERIRAELPVLGEHLDRCVRTGCFCSYDPDSTVRVTVGS